MAEVSQLPKNWSLALLRAVAEINPTLDKSAFDDELPVSFVPMPAVEAETGKIDVSQTRRLGEVKKGYTPFQTNDVLFAKITPCMENGKMAVAPDLCNKLGFGSTEFHVLRAYRGIEPKFIYYFVSSKSFRFNAEHNMTGAVGQRRVPTPYLETCSVPIPPTNEQRRIVAKIEELFSELDKGIESLKTARELLKIYRPAILKHAFEGKLTAPWREENRDKLETVVQLLTRIQQERRAHYQRQLEEWEAAFREWEARGKEGKKPSKPIAPEPVSLITGEQKAHLPDIPFGWAWFRLSNLAIESVLGKMLDKEKNKGEFKPYLRNINVRWGNFDLSDLLQMRFEENEAERYGLRDGDLVICEGGEPGRCAIWRNGAKDMRIQKALHRVRLPDSLIKAEYLFYCIIFSKETGLLSRHFTGTTIKHLTGEGLANVEIPFCGNLEEQECLIKEIESQFSNIDNLECEIDSALERAETLRQSILKKTFSGKLVAQDPDDEPASLLLERIKAEKAAGSTAKKQAKSKRKAVA